MTKRIILGAVAILMVIAAAYAAFFIAPEERTMGLIQRIFYFHVASAWAGFTAFFLCFLGNLLYVWKRDQKYDWLSVSGAEVGLAFTTVVLITGPIWAHPVWGIWWTWDARLTSTFVLWLVAHPAPSAGHHGRPGLRARPHDEVRLFLFRAGHACPDALPGR